MRAILEKVYPGRDHAFKYHEFYQQRRFDCPFHYHPEIELPHSYVNDERTERAGSVVFQFLPECLGAGFFQLGELREIRTLLERARVGLAFHGPVRERVARAMMQFKTLEGTARLITFLEILQALAGSRDHRRLASPTYAPSLALYQGERINRVCELISKRFREPITQSEASRVAKMSGPSFSRFFRRATNRTFRAFLNEVRVGHASRLLLESDLSVAEICYDSGFGNLSNFNRQFLKLRRVSPRNYRRKATSSAS
jgi:AraC-like DNA-binding protein